MNHLFININKLFSRRGVTLAIFIRLFAALLILSFIAPAHPASRCTAAENPVEERDLTARLNTIEQAIESRRKALGIPGLSLVIVKDDQVVFMKGFGVKDVERNTPVTPNTLFSIGSATKAFTAIATMISADEGKLSLDDSPKKFLPYFKLRDPDADSRVTVRDLLCHRTGLNRTDLAMSTGTLSREELIRVVGNAKPTAKFREKFQYQNVMYAAVGEVVAKSTASSWEKVVSERIFKPLDMRASNMSLAELHGAPDFSFGYDYNAETKQTRVLKSLDVSAIGPAGSINSNARDMAQWLRLMLGSGAFEGKRLVSEKNFDELVTQHIQIAPKFGYGLGWFLREWKGRKEINHGGNLEGFNAMVAMIPEQRLGFVLLSNVSASPLADEARNIVFSSLIDQPQISGAAAPAAPAGDPRREVGEYLVPGTDVTFKVALNDGNLTLTVPNQPLTTLENVGGRRYKFASPAPDGFFVTFRPSTTNPNETEVYLEQPHGNVILTPVKAKETSAPKPSDVRGSAALNELVGKYGNEKKAVLEIAVRNDAVSLLIGGAKASDPNAQSSVPQGEISKPLIEKERDKYGISGLPDAFLIIAKRDESGKLIGLTFTQPSGDIYLSRIPSPNDKPSAADLMQKAIDAAGGEPNLRKHNSMVMEISTDFENEGVTGEVVVSAAAPNLSASTTTLIALNKKIGTVSEYFNSDTSGVIASFGSPFTRTGKLLDDARIASDFYALLNWKTLYKGVTIKGQSRIDDEDVYVIEKTPTAGHPVIDYISAKSFLLLRRETQLPIGVGNLTIPATETFSDYRSVDGVMMPFKIVAYNPGQGTAVSIVKNIRFNVEIPRSVFRLT